MTIICQLKFKNQIEEGSDCKNETKTAPLLQGRANSKTKFFCRIRQSGTVPVIMLVLSLLPFFNWPPHSPNDFSGITSLMNYL